MIDDDSLEVVVDRIRNEYENIPKLVSQVLEAVINK